MARPRRKSLPRGVRERRYASGNAAYWISFQVKGKQVHEAAGTDLRTAISLKRTRDEEAAAGTYVPGRGSSQQLTLRSFSEVWIERARATGRRSIADDEQRMRDHVLPDFGDVPLDAIRPKHVAAWIETMTTTAVLGPKTVNNVHGVLNNCLQRAVFEELIPMNPARGLPRGILPKIPRRHVPAWSRDECATWIADEWIPEDRQTAYTIAMFTGARLGEVAGMRWGDLDTRSRPLWLWALRTQYGGATLKTDEHRSVPIHGELEAVLAKWRSDGWPRFMRREPTLEDFVVPRGDGTVHSKQSLGAKAVARHASLVGIEKGERDFHSFRRSMITYCRTDGANPDVLERITHNSAGKTIDTYTLYEWDTLCAAISCLKVRRRTNAGLPVPAVET